MYSATLGRFLQRDPIGYYDHMNLYQYVRNNSVNYIDPHGLLCENWWSEWSDFVAPNFDDPTSFGVNFWMSLYEDRTWENVNFRLAYSGRSFGKISPGLNANLIANTQGIFFNYGIGIGVGRGISATINYGNRLTSTSPGITFSAKGGNGLLGYSYSGRLSENGYSNSFGFGWGFGNGFSVTGNQTIQLIKF